MYKHIKIVFCYIVLFINITNAQLCSSTINTTLESRLIATNTASFSLACCQYNVIANCTPVDYVSSCQSNYYLSACINGYNGSYCASFIQGTTCNIINTIPINCTGLAEVYENSLSQFLYICCNTDGSNCIQSSTYCGSNAAAICILDETGVTCSGISPPPPSYPIPYAISRCITNKYIQGTSTTNFIITQTQTQYISNSTSSSDSSNIGVIVGPVIAAVVIIAGIIIFLFWRRKKNYQSKFQSVITNNDNDFMLQYKVPVSVPSSPTSITNANSISTNIKKPDVPEHMTYSTLQEIKTYQKPHT